MGWGSCMCSTVVQYYVCFFCYRESWPWMELHSLMNSFSLMKLDSTWTKQEGGNITLCAAISLRGLLHHHAKLGPYNSQHILTFLDALHNIVVQNRPDQPWFVVVWDNVSFHQAALVQAWFTNHNQFEVVYLPPYSSFLNPIEEFFSAWRWRVYDRQPHARMPLLQAMEQACGDIQVTAIHGWFRHARGCFLPGRRHCLRCRWGPVARPQQTAGSMSPHMHNCHDFLFTV